MTTDLLEVFGWKINYTKVAAGESFVTTFPSTVLSSQLPNIRYILSGKLQLQYSMSISENAPAILIAGDSPALDLNLDTITYPAGLSITIIAETAVEFISINARNNLGQLPQVEKLILKNNQSLDITERKVFLCRGTISANGTEYTGPVALEITGIKTINAITDCYALYINNLP